MKHDIVTLVPAVLALAFVACNKPPPDPDDVGPGAVRGGAGGSVTPVGSGGSAPVDEGGAGGGPGGAPGAGGMLGGGGGGAGAGGGGGAGPASRDADADARDSAGAAGQGGSSGGSGGASGTGGAPVDPLPPGVQGHPDPTVNYPKYPGFTLALVEEFAQPLDLDADSIWTWSDGGLTEGKVRFVKNAITFRDGKMIITARTPGVPGSASFAEPVADGDAGFVANKEVASGELRTKFNNYRYGRYEVRFKPPTSNGNFVSTMFVFRTPKFEEWRELDIELTADRPNKVFTNLIYANGVGAWNPSIAEPGEQFPEGPGAMPLPAGFSHQGQFHTYGFEWLPNKVTWFVDGVPVRVKTGGRLPIPERSAKIIMNLWIFAIAGGFGGDPTRNVYPMSAEYEWFRFYRWNEEKTYPCEGAPACLPAQDRNKSKNNASDGLPP